MNLDQAIIASNIMKKGLKIKADKLAKSKHADDEHIQAPSDLGREKGVTPDKDGHIIAVDKKNKPKKRKNMTDTF